MTNTAFSKIEEMIGSAPIVVFMKGSAQFPMCGFSARTCQVLQAAGAKDFLSVDVLADEEVRSGIKEFTKWPTIPQVFIQGEFVGGCDIVCELYERGELQEKIAHLSAT